MRFTWLLRLAVVSCCRTAGQQVGTVMDEEHLPLAIGVCSRSGGCSHHLHNVTLDANWRLLHDDNQRRRCFSNGNWDKSLCSDPETCAWSCAVEGVNRDGYESLYGVTLEPHDGIRMRHMARRTHTAHGSMRLYIMEDESSYKVFKLKNREFAFEVDTSRLPCGLRGSVYFVSMNPDGHMVGGNTAGARFGTGYCDAHCPRDLQFVAGEANILDWDPEANTGRYGHCCSELHLWRANAQKASMSMHPCSVDKATRCQGDACGSTTSWGLCQGRGGCELPALGRSGDNLFGGGGSIDTTKPFTVVTRFLTDDGSDTGELFGIQRFFVQDGRIIDNVADDSGGAAVTEAYCMAQMATSGGRQRRGSEMWNGQSLHSLGEALDRGMVMVLALEDESGGPELTAAGTHLVPCPVDAGEPAARTAYPESSVRYWGFRHGPIGSTVEATVTATVGGGFLGNERVAWTYTDGKASEGKARNEWQPRPSPFNHSLLYFYNTFSGQTSWTLPPTQSNPEHGAAGGDSEEVTQRWLLRGIKVSHSSRFPGGIIEGILFAPASVLIVGAILLTSLPAAVSALLFGCRRGGNTTVARVHRPRGSQQSRF